jgi:hypothetical protein
MVPFASPLHPMPPSVHWTTLFWCATRPRGCNCIPCLRPNCTTACSSRCQTTSRCPMAAPNSNSLPRRVLSFPASSTTMSADGPPLPTVAGRRSNCGAPPPTRAIRATGLRRLSPRTLIATKRLLARPVSSTPSSCARRANSPSPPCTLPRFSTIRSAAKGFATPPSSSRSTTPVRCRSTSATGASSPRAGCSASRWPRPIARWRPAKWR